MKQSLGVFAVETQFKGLGSLRLLQGDLTVDPEVEPSGVPLY